jgi:hypothetical protein
MASEPPTTPTSSKTPRKHHQRRAYQQAEGLFRVVGSCRAREGTEEALGDRRLRECDPREPNEEEAEHHDHRFSQCTHDHGKRILL